MTNDFQSFWLVIAGPSQNRIGWQVEYFEAENEILLRSCRSELWLTAFNAFRAFMTSPVHTSFDPAIAALLV